MAFPVVESVTPTIFSTAATAHLVTMPATVNAGDLLIARITTAGSNANGAVTTPGAWNLLHSTVGGTTTRLSAYYKIAVGDEDGTTVDFVTFAAVKAVAHVHRISGWHGTTPPEVGTATTGSSVSPDPPSLTPSWGAADTLWLASCGAALGGSQSVSAYPTDYINGNDDITTTSGAAFIGSANRNLNAASDDPGAFTLTLTAVWVAQTLAVQPLTAQTLTGNLFVSTSTFPAGSVTLSSTVAASGTTVTVTTGGTVTITGPGGVVYTGGSGVVVLPAGSYTWASTDGASGSFAIAGGAANRMGGSGAIRKPPRHVGR